MMTRILKNIVILLSLLLLSKCSDLENQIFDVNINEGWKIISSANSKDTGKEISISGYNSKEWYDANLPSTVLKALIENGVYSDIYKADNLDKIPTDQFNVSWWYRKSLKLENINSNENFRLNFEGINYRANIWLNGNLIANSDSIVGAFSVFDIDITEFVQEGQNAIAVEIIPPKRDDLTIGFVDWNPWAPDNNMGMWRGVYLKRTNSVSLNHVYVKSDLNLQTMEEAELIISTELINHSNEETKVQVTGEIGSIYFTEDFILQPKEKRNVVFNSEKHSQLSIKNPRIWWPNNLGDPNLYNLILSAKIDKEITDNKNVRFGIRDIEQYVNEEGHKGYKVNGKNILIRGGGWVDDLTLSDSDEKVKAQLDYVKHMNLNTIRLEGFWGNNKEIYDYADENGILIMIGWSCYWEWEGYCGRPETEFMSITTPEDIELHARGYRDQVEWLRNHPSVFLWVYGSDKLPVPALERKLNDYLSELDDTRPILASCKYWDFGTEHYNISDVSGPVGVKMLGPYAYVTPNYWYQDKNIGGAYGFNTETGPGPQVPPIESIKKMIPEENLWPIDKMWDFHSGRNEFNNLNHYLKAFNARYGESQNVEEFAFKSQISNYEAIRGMFESFAVNKPNATGVIQWMLNSAWPEMFWQLYDWYLMPNGAFYGTKTACEPLQLIYNYADKNIYANNEYNESYNDLEAEIKVLDINSEVIFTQSVTYSIEEASSKMIFDIPELESLTTTYFIDLRLKTNNKEISKNFYWLSTKEDVLDYENSEWFKTPFESYGDLTGLNNLPEAEIQTTYEFTTYETEQEITVTIENTSDVIAFFIELKLVEENTGEVILPVFWDDNYISLLPGEKREIKAKYSLEKDAKKPELRIKGMNLNK